MRSFQAALAALVLIFLTACQKASPDKSNDLEVRTYDVPRGAVRPLFASIRDALWMNDKNLGRAFITPDGRVSVLAPPSYQAGFQAIVDEVVKHPPTSEASIELHYWIVAGRPSAAPVAPPAELGEIQPGLAEILRKQGPQAFTLVERVQLRSLQYEEGNVKAGDWHLKQFAYWDGDGTVSSVYLDAPKGDFLKTTVRLAPDQVVVLDGIAQPPGDAGAGATLYTLVRLAPRADGSHP